MLGSFGYLPTRKDLREANRCALSRTACGQQVRVCYPQLAGCCEHDWIPTLCGMLASPSICRFCTHWHFVNHFHLTSVFHYATILPVHASLQLSSVAVHICRSVVHATRTLPTVEAIWRRPSLRTAAWRPWQTCLAGQ